MAHDYLDELLAKRSARNPDFPRMVDEAVARQDRAQGRQDAPSTTKTAPLLRATLARQRVLTARMRRKALV